MFYVDPVAMVPCFCALVNFHQGRSSLDRTDWPIARVKGWLPGLKGCCVNGGAQGEAFRLLVLEEDSGTSTSYSFDLSDTLLTLLDISLQ